MLTDEYIREGDKFLKKFQADDKESAIKRAINIAKLRLMKQEKLQRWNQQIDIFR